MLDIVLLGLNHTTAPVELRESLAFSKDEADATLEAIQKYPSIKEVILFSTCNRVEVLMVVENIPRAVEDIKLYISNFKNVPVYEFEKALYLYNSHEAVRHIFRVTSSLDSMMVGEPQILGQIKAAYRSATSKKTSSVILNKLLHKAFFVAKRVRSETGIGDHAVSISYAAIELGRKIFGALADKKALLIGAGEMAELAVEQLIRNRVENIYIANRTFKRALELAERFNGKPIRLEEISDCLKSVDIIISSTDSPGFMVTSDQVKRIIRTRKNRPLFFIDIAVPRDIDPKINRLTNSYVYDIDDLKSVIDENIENREKESIKGERIIDEAVIRFGRWYESLEVVPTIVELRKKLDTIAKTEINKTFQSLNHLSDDDRQAIHRMTNSLVSKILHDPTLMLKSNGCYRNKSVYLDITRKLFKLDE